MRSVIVAPLCLAVLALILATNSSVLAEDKTHDGTVVRAGSGKLTMTDTAGKKEHTHDVPATAKITCDGKDCKLDELKKGYSVKVTTEKKGTTEVVTKIEAKKDDK